MVTGVGIGVGIVAAIIAILSLLVGYPDMLRFFSKLHFPPARFYLNAIKAIERLEALGEEETDSAGHKLRFGEVKRQDASFMELAVILRERGIFREDSLAIRLCDEPETGMESASITITPNLVYVREGQQEVIETDAFDPAKTTTELRNAARDIAQRRLAVYIVVLIPLWFILHTLLIIYACFRTH